MLLHFAKHYFNGGSGIKNIMDIHVFLSKHDADLDKDYLEKELEKLNLAEFRNDAEHLAAVWFKGERMDENAKEMAEYVFSSGIYGTMQNSITNYVRKKSKTHYILHRIFLPLDVMAGLHPILGKAPVLLPFFWFTRIANAILTKSGRIAREIKIVSKIK